MTEAADNEFRAGAKWAKEFMQSEIAVRDSEIVALKAEIAALKVELEQTRVNWQPIETAGDDCKDEPVLIYRPDTARRGEFLGVCYWDDGEIWTGWVPIAGAYTIDNPTHWARTPAPPSKVTAC